MEFKQKTSKDKTIMLFERIEAKSVEQAIRKIIEINNEDKNIAKELKRMAEDLGMTVSDPGISPISIILSPMEAAATMGWRCMTPFRHPRRPWRSHALER